MSLVERLFGLKKNGTTVRMEIVAGVTTFMPMAFTYSVADGIMWGFVGHAGIHLFAGRGREVHWVVYVPSALFIAKYALI